MIRYLCICLLLYKNVFIIASTNKNIPSEIGPYESNLRENQKSSHARIRRDFWPPRWKAWENAETGIFGDQVTPKNNYFHGTQPNEYPPPMYNGHGHYINDQISEQVYPTRNYNRQKVHTLNFPPDNGQNERLISISPWYPANNPYESNVKFTSEPQNTFSFDYKDEDWFKDISTDSKKPRKEKLPSVREKISTESDKNVAIIDSMNNVLCPPGKHSGLFIHPHDCRFYVECLDGRARIEPCLSGTLFNPVTFECDLPDKVKCFSRTPLHALPQNKINVNKENNLLCQEKFTGLVAYPNDCTKFLQCDRGFAHIMECRIGTVFNPLLKTCDWPKNVAGCQHLSEESTNENNSWKPIVSPVPRSLDENIYNFKPNKPTNQYLNQAIDCFSNHRLHRHPENCFKYYVCDHGVAKEMECGPGTAFNEAIQTCDWPKNVPGCADIPFKIVPSIRWTQLDLRVENSEEAYSSEEQVQPFGSPTHTLQSPNDWNKNIFGTTVKPFESQYNLPATENNYDNSPSDHDYQESRFNQLQIVEKPKLIESENRTKFGKKIHQTWDKPQGHWHHYTPITSTPSVSWPDFWNDSDEIVIDKTNGQYSTESINKNLDPVQSIFTPATNQNPYGILFIINNTQGASITKQPIIYQGHSKTRTQNSKVHSISDSPVHNSNPINNSLLELSTVQPISTDNHSASSAPSIKSDQDMQVLQNPGLNNSPKELQNTEYPQNLFSLEDYDFDFDINEDYIYEKEEEIQKTTDLPVTESSVMKINDQPQINLDEVLSPQEKAEPPFPNYFIPPVKDLYESLKDDILLTPENNQVIRLRGGPGPDEGYLEVQGSQPGWGIVCDENGGWKLKEAHLVCRQLGYTRGADRTWQGRPKSMPEWIAASSVVCQGNETRFQFCKFNHSQECSTRSTPIGIKCLPNRISYCGSDEIPYKGHCYHYANSTNSLNHAEAIKYCHSRNSRLLDIVDQLENNFISEWLIQLKPDVNSIMTSGIGILAINRTLWMWEDSDATRFRFAKWWPGWMADREHPPAIGSRPVCIVMKKVFPCHYHTEEDCKTDYFFWDIEDCASSFKGHSLICKRPYKDIGCVYGNGHQYTGKANISSQGKGCLPWSDAAIAHELRVQVPNKEIREQLKNHNYCRNPNPDINSKPWCFTNSIGEKEDCDIPYCGKIISKKSIGTTCKPKHFECSPGQCIPNPWVCDGEKDCTNGADEKKCVSHISSFKKYVKNKLDGYEKEKWLHTSAKTCASKCMEADFVCRSFTYNRQEKICLLSDQNIGSTGALIFSETDDYYEMKSRTTDCTGLFACENQRCINKTQVCNGKNDCGDRSDETACSFEDLDYDIRLRGSKSNHEGRLEVKLFGKWGQVCDDGFDMADANVACRELGFSFGALQVVRNAFYGNMEEETFFNLDQVGCFGNESKIVHCDSEGWGIHDCNPDEAVGIVCKRSINNCPEKYWKCDNSPKCIPYEYICDSVKDCNETTSFSSDESSKYCDASFAVRLVDGKNSMEGRLEVRHHGIWGSVCDDQFSDIEASVVCRSLGFYGSAKAKNNGLFGSSNGPIWLEEVNCEGNETSVNKCKHKPWGNHKCDHTEDIGIICSQRIERQPRLKVNDILPRTCGKRVNIPTNNFIHEKVIRSSIAPKKSYPWQASIRQKTYSSSLHQCGAVILSSIHVLTAAHCLEGYMKNVFFVRAGDYDVDIKEDSEIDIDIENYYIHENFRKGHVQDNDIALILLKGKGLPLGEDIMPICLPENNTEYTPGLNCTISGFGVIEPGQGFSKKLRFGWVPIIDPMICKEHHVYGYLNLTEGMICAGHLDGGIDSCHGDSGGPLACPEDDAYTLYGLTSWGEFCGTPNKPGVYVKVTHYLNWIYSKLEESIRGRHLF